MLSFNTLFRRPIARVDKGKSEKNFVPLTVPELKALKGFALHLDGCIAAASC